MHIDHGIAQNTENTFTAFDLYASTINLASLIYEGYNLVSTLDIESSTTTNQTLKKALSDISKRLENGEFLSEALAKHSDIFSKQYIAIVRAGEVCGVLEEAMLIVLKKLPISDIPTLPDPNEDICDFCDLLGMLLTYGVGIKLALETVSEAIKDPKFAQAILNAISEIQEGESFLNALDKYPEFFSADFLNTMKDNYEEGTLYRALIKYASDHRRVHNGFALFASSSDISELSNFCRYMQIHLEADYPIIDTLEICVESSFGEFKEAILGVIIRMKNGELLANALEQYPQFFNKTFIDTIRVGNQANRLDFVFMRIAELLESNQSTNL